MGSILNLLEISLNRSGTLTVATHRIHSLGVKCPYLVGHCTRLRIGCAQTEHNTLHTSLRRIVEYVESAVACMFGGKRMRVTPSFCDMLVEVGRGRSVWIKLLGIKAFQMFLSAHGEHREEAHESGGCK